jgi:hypothetical protein
MHHRTAGAARFISHARPKLVAEWITSSGLAGGQATWTDTVNGLVLTETGTITTTTSGGTNNWLVFPGTSGNYMSKTDGTGNLPGGDAERTVVLCGSFEAGRFCGFSWGEPVNFGAFTLGVQGTGATSGEISADYYNAFAAGGDVVSAKGPGIWFLTLNSIGVVRLYHGDQLVLTDIDLSLDTGTERINLMRPYSSGGTPAAGNIGYIGVYDGVLGDTARQAVVDRLNPLYLGITDAPVAADVVFTANSATTGTVTATLSDWRSVMVGVITTSVTKPSVDRIKAGLDHLGNQATPYTLGPALTDDAALEVGPIGLTPNATNYPHYFMKDAYGNVGTVQTGADDDTPPVTIPTAITPTTITFSETVLSPFVVSTLVSDQPATFTKVSGSAAFTVSTTGIVTLVSDLPHGSYSFVARATNTAGTFDATIGVTVTVAAVAADFSVRFGELTATGSGGAQARNAAGFVVNFDSIESQPSTRWAVVSGRLVATGTPAMASEQITVTVDGESLAINIVVVPNMVTVKDHTEFAAISMTPAGTGDFTIHLRAGANIPAATFNSKIAGTSTSSRRTLGGTLMVTGESARGVPAANLDGKLKPRFFSGGAFKLFNLNASPTQLADQEYNNSKTQGIFQIDNSPTTDIVLDTIVSVGNSRAIAWPGKTAATTGNDMGHDPWGALIRVNTVTGSFRPYKDGQVTSGGTTGPDIITCGTSGVKRILMGMHSLGGGVYELQFSDNVGNDHSVNNALVSGQGASRSIISGETITGLDGGSAVVMDAPAGVEAAEGRLAATGPAYSYIILGTRWLDSPTAVQGGGTANTVKNMTIRNCRVTGCDSMVHPAAIEKVILEQNSFGLFTTDLFQVPNPAASPTYQLIIRRNDFYGSMYAPSDLGAPHSDYLQPFGASASPWPGVQIHHNRWLCNARAGAQGIMAADSGAFENSSIFGNIFVLNRGGVAMTLKINNNTAYMHNTVLVSQKDTGLPDNWAGGNGSGMAMNFNPVAPATNLYGGYNVARRFAITGVKTEYNYGLYGNVVMDQDDMFVGLAATKPSRPYYFETFAEVMVGAQTKSPIDPKAGALGTNSNWTDYPYYVTTDFSHITAPGFTAPVYDPGVPSTLTLSSPTASGGTAVFTAGVTVTTPAGAVYYVVYPSTVTVPNATQVQAGLDGDGAAATEDGTLGASTAGVKTVAETAIAAGSYKVSFVQVSGSNVSPVVTSATMTVVPAGITAITESFTHSDTTANKTPVECPMFTPTAGEPLLIHVTLVNNSSNAREIATVVTLGSPGRSPGTGTAATLVAHGYDSRATGKVFIVESPSAVASTVQVSYNDGVNDDTKGGCEVWACQITGAKTSGTVGVVANLPDDPANGTTIVPAITTGTANSIVMYMAACTSGASGAPIIVTTGATELYNHATGNATAEGDGVLAVAWEAAATAGAYTATFNRSFTGTRWGCAYEVKANVAAPLGVGTMVIGTTFEVA